MKRIITILYGFLILLPLDIFGSVLFVHSAPEKYRPLIEREVAEFEEANKYFAAMMNLIKSDPRPFYFVPIDQSLFHFFEFDSVNQGATFMSAQETWNRFGAYQIENETSEWNKAYASLLKSIAGFPFLVLPLMQGEDLFQKSSLIHEVFHAYQFAKDPKMHADAYKVKVAEIEAYLIEGIAGISSSVQKEWAKNPALGDLVEYFVKGCELTHQDHININAALIEMWDLLNVQGLYTPINQITKRDVTVNDLTTLKTFISEL